MHMPAGDWEGGKNSWFSVPGREGGKVDQCPELAQNRETLEDSVVTSRLKVCSVLSALLGGIVGSHMKVN